MWTHFNPNYKRIHFNLCLPHQSIFEWLNLYCLPFNMHLLYLPHFLHRLCQWKVSLRNQLSCLYACLQDLLHRHHLCLLLEYFIHPHCRGVHVQLALSLRRHHQILPPLQCPADQLRCLRLRVRLLSLGSARSRLHHGQCRVLCERNNGNNSRLHPLLRQLQLKSPPLRHSQQQLCL